MTPSERELLSCIAEAAAAVKKLSPYRGANADPHEWAARSIAIQDLPTIGVRISPEWLGSDSASRKARSRGLQALAAAGLITLASTNGSFPTHAALTKSGRATAIRVAAEGMVREP